MRDDHFVEEIANVKRLLVFRVVRVAVVAVLLLDEQHGQENVTQVGKMQAVFERDRVVTWSEDFYLFHRLE